MIRKRIDGANHTTVSVLDSRLKNHQQTFDTYKSFATRLHARTLALMSCVNPDEILKFQEVDVELTAHDSAIFDELLKLESLKRESASLSVGGNGNIIHPRDMSHNIYWC